MTATNSTDKWLRDQRMAFVCRGWRLRPYCEGWVLEQLVLPHNANKNGRDYSVGDITKERWKVEKYPHTIDQGLHMMWEKVAKQEIGEVQSFDELREALVAIADEIEKCVRDAVNEKRAA